MHYYYCKKPIYHGLEKSTASYKGSFSACKGRGAYGIYIIQIGERDGRRGQVAQGGHSTPPAPQPSIPNHELKNQARGSETSTVADENQIRGRSPQPRRKVKSSASCKNVSEGEVWQGHHNRSTCVFRWPGHSVNVWHIVRGTQQLPQ